MTHTADQPAPHETGSERATVTSLPYHPVTLITEWPLPTTADEVESLWSNNDQLQRTYDDPPHPDELTDTYVHPVTETDSWTIFHISLYGIGCDLYFWHTNGDYGFRISTLETDVEEITAAFHALAEATQ